jgi:hypothetical protein
MVKLKVGLLYLGLHNQLVKTYGCIVISRKEFFGKIGKHYMLPKQLRHYVLKEMEESNLIEKVNRDEIKILPYEIDIEENYQELIKMIEKDFYLDETKDL